MSIFFAAFVSSLIIIGGSLPYGFPLFTPCVIFFFTAYLLRFKNISLDKQFILFIGLILSYVLPLGILGTFNSNNIYELINAASVFSFFIILTTILKSNRQFERFTHYFQSFSFLFSFLLAFAGNYKFYLLMQGDKIPILYRSDGTYPWGTSLVSDYNSFSLCLLIGLISGYYIIKRKNGIVFSIFCSLMFLTIFFSLLLSASRRAWISLFLLGCAFAVFTVKDHIKNFSFTFPHFQFNRKKIISAFLLGLFIFSLSIIAVKAFPSRLQFAHPTHLTSIKNRFMNISDFFEIQPRQFSRLKLYNYAFELIDEYSILHLIIGKGSIYQYLFEQRFNKHGYSYPHNLILSAMLQSGIIGATIIVGYLCYCFYIYIFHLNYHDTSFYLIIAILSGFYYLISGNSIFSSKIFVFFNLLMPLLININYRRYFKHDSDAISID